MKRRSVVASPAWIGLRAASPLAAALAVPRVRAQSASAGGKRIALVIGNRDYPGEAEIPSMHTNAKRVQVSLAALDFVVTTVLDQDRDGVARSVEHFAQDVRAVGPDGVVLFYFCGHGMQIDAQNFLLPARRPPVSLPLDEALKEYPALRRDVLDALPRRPDGLTMAVIDACRVSLSRPRGRDGRPVANDGLNQVAAEDGEMIVFSTGAGRPALAFSDENRLTFYTEKFVSSLEALVRSPSEMSFGDFFTNVANDVRSSMLGHRNQDIQALAQAPFMANNARRLVRVSPRLPQRAPPRPASVAVPVPVKPDTRELEAAAIARLQQTLWAPDVVRQAQEFLGRYPESGFAGTARAAQFGAAEAARVLEAMQESMEGGLAQADFDIPTGTTAEVAEDIRRSARGDKDAAARMGGRLKSAEKSGPLVRRYERWMRYAAELGNGIASFEISQHYQAQNRGALAGAYRAKAIATGYTPPPGLRTKL